jgi:hypothetical protein
MNSSKGFESHSLHAVHGLYILFINTKTYYCLKAIAQSSTNIHNDNDNLVDLEKTDRVTS